MDSQTTPPVVKWYRAYAFALTIVYLLVAIMGVLALFAPIDFKDLKDLPPWLFQLYASFLILVGLLFFGAFLASFFIPKKPWAWIYHLVLICLGLTSACCLPISIPLLVFWIRPECKGYFGRT